MKLRGFEIIAAYKTAGIHIPQRKTSLSAGYDIEAAEDMLLNSNTLSMIPTGLKAYMQDDEYLGIHIRSGLAVKQKLSLINGQGIIDADYYNNAQNEGHIMIAIYNHSAEQVEVKKGDRIAQGIFYRYLKADHDIPGSFAVRTGGFGSTGKQ